MLTTRPARSLFYVSDKLICGHEVSQIVNLVFSKQAGMESLKDDTNLADVDIIINNRIFHCHKTILAAMSPYFRTMFTGGMMESRQKRINLQVYYYL